MSQALYCECNCEDVEKIFLVQYTTNETPKLFCKDCFADPANTRNAKFACNIKTKRVFKQKELDA